MSTAAHLFDHRLFGDWYSTEEVRQIFDEKSMLRNWLEVEAALAETQAELDIIPSWAATAIRDAVDGADLPLEQLARDVKETAHVLVPVLRELERWCGPAGRYVHLGATTQDIMDTAAVLQLKQVYGIVTRDLKAIIRRLIELAQAHRDTVMMGRTHGVHALPTTLGFKFSVWIAELLRHLERLDQSAARVLVGQLGGAVGTLAGFGPRAVELRSRLMERLGLNVPVIAWQASRDNISEFVILAGLLGGSLGKMGNEIAHLHTTEIAELAEPSSERKVGSSTMPNKQNPILSEQTVALARLLQGLASQALGSLRTRGERDATTWCAEMYAVPEAACLLAAQLQLMNQVLNGLTVNTERMRHNMEQLSDAQFSQELMLKLVDSLGRDKAHSLVAELALQALEQKEELKSLAMDRRTIEQILDVPEILEAFQLEVSLGEAKNEVDRMIERARSELQSRN